MKTPLYVFCLYQIAGILTVSLHHDYENFEYYELKIDIRLLFTYFAFLIIILNAAQFCKAHHPKKTQYCSLVFKVFSNTFSKPVFIVRQKDLP